MEIFDKALEFYKISERLSEPEAILKAREVERLSEAGFQVLSIKSEDVSEWDTDAYVETGYPEWAALTECIIGFEVNGKQGQVSALWSDEVNYYGDLKDKLTFVDVQSYDGNSVVRHADTIQYLLKNDPAILSSLTKAITDHKGMHEDRIITVTPSEVVDVYQVTVTNGREDIILDVRAGLDQRGETEVWRVRDSGDRPVFVAEQYRGAAEYNSRHGHLEEAPLLSLTTDDLKVAITPLHQAAHPEVAEWRKEEERCAIEGRPYYGYGNVGAPAREFFEVFRMASVGEGEGTDLGIDVPMTEDYRSRVAIDGSDTEKDNYFRLLIDISSEGEPILTIYDGDPDGELSKEIFETHYDRIKEATAQYVAKIQQGADEIPFDSIADDEVREVADTLQGNDAVMAQLLVDDDENDPVAYHDDREPMAADWGDIPERAAPNDDGRLLHEVDGKTIATVDVPEHLAKKFDLDTLDEIGVPFDDNGKVELHLKTNGGDVTLDRQFPVMTYVGRFEADLFAHHRDALQEEADHMSAETAATKTKMENSITVTADSDFPDSDALHRHLKVSIGGQEMDVIAAYNEDGRATGVEVDPDQDGFDPAMDGGARHNELSDLLETVKDHVIRQVQDYHDNVDDRILQDTGWQNSRTLEAGYAVIPEEEIDRVGLEEEASGSYLTGGDFRTSEGYPIRLEFDSNANIETATIPGTKTSLKPVLEGSRDHFVEAKAQLADHGLVLSKAESGDYRVDYHKSSSSYREGERGSVRYADNVTAAVDVGQKMAADRDKQVATRFQDDERSERQAA